MKDIGTPLEQCEAWFEKVEHRYKNNLGGLNILVEKSTGKFVGQCGLLVQEVDEKEELEIGYSLLPEFLGNGYATEAARFCRDYAFEHIFRDFLISIIHVDNVRSEKIALKNRMSLTKQTMFRGMPVNIFRITREEMGENKMNVINPEKIQRRDVDLSRLYTQTNHAPDFHRMNITDIENFIRRIGAGDQ